MTNIALLSESDEPLDERVAGRLQARYGKALGGLDRPMALQVQALWNPVLDTLLDHRSVRRFLPRSLPRGALEVLVAAAQSAPSSSNMQTWSLVVVESPERKARLAELCAGQKHVADAPAFLVWVADLSRHADIAEAQGAPREGLDYLESFLTAAIDVALAAQSAVVALESLGLGCVYIGAVRNNIEAMAEALELPPQAVPIVGLCVGWPDPQGQATVKPRLPQAAVLHRETYRGDHPAHAGAYDQILQRFQDGQGLKPIGWIASVLAKIAHATSLNGREGLSDALKRRGFPLR